MTFRKATPHDHHLSVPAAFSRAELVALFNALLLDAMSDDHDTAERTKLLGKLTYLLDTSEPPKA